MKHLATAVALVLLTGCELFGNGAKTAFRGEQAYQYVATQLEFGPRVPGTEGHARTGEWIAAHLRERADTVVEQRWTHVTVAGDTLPMRNILARFRPTAEDRVLYITHWDTRPISENAPDSAGRLIPVPGANDGASGTAVLMALADVLARTPPAVGVDLLFVDGEDYGDFDAEGRPDVLIGSRYFVNNLPSPDYRPLYGVVWDMVGARDLELLQEGFSVQAAPEVVSRVWALAADLGYREYFVPRVGYAVTDDHLPFLEKGMRVIDVIQYPYSEHHKPSDTLEQISAESLQVVGDVATALVVN